MPNLFTVKLYLQIKVIPLSMSLMLNTKVSVNSCLFKRKKRNPLNFTCLNSHCIEHIWPMLSWAINWWWHRFGSVYGCLFWFSLNIVQLSNRNPYFYRFRCHHPLITQLNPCLSKSWTQLFLKRPNHTWSETEVGRQFRCWTCVQTNKQANLEEKYQMKSHPALNIELKKKKKKLVKLKWKSKEKKNVGNY